jgi:outer membrane protein assembly factor BamD
MNILYKKYFLFFLLTIIPLILFSCVSGSKSDIKTEDPDEAFKIAKANYDKKDYLQAIEDFSLIKIKFSGSKIIDKSQYYLAMCHYNRSEFVLGAYEFDYLMKNYSTSEFVSTSRYMLAMCYYNLSPDYSLDQAYTYLAINEFLIFIDLYPDDKNVSEAEKKIKELKNKLAYKDFHSGELYFKMDNYKAAIVYFDNVLDEYFDTEWADNSLYGKIQALIKKKKYEDAMKEIQRFEKKFGSSELLMNVLSLKKEIPL